MTFSRLSGLLLYFFCKDGSDRLMRWSLALNFLCAVFDCLFEVSLVSLAICLALFFPCDTRTHTHTHTHTHTPVVVDQCVII